MPCLECMVFGRCEVSLETMGHTHARSSLLSFSLSFSLPFFLSFLLFLFLYSTIVKCCTQGRTHTQRPHAAAVVVAVLLRVYPLLSCRVVSSLPGMSTRARAPSSFLTSSRGRGENTTYVPRRHCQQPVRWHERRFENLSLFLSLLFSPLPPSLPRRPCVFYKSSCILNSIILSLIVEERPRVSRI